MEDVRDVVSLSLDESLGGEGEEGRGRGRTLRSLLLRRRSRCLLLLVLLRGVRAGGMEGKLVSGGLES